MPEAVVIEDTAPDVAGAIRLLRQRTGISQRELALRMQVPRTYVSKIENDKACPTIGSLHRLAQAMETSVAHLLRCCTGDGGAAWSADNQPGQELPEDSFVRAMEDYLPSLDATQRELVLGEMRKRSQKASAAAAR